MLAWGSAAQAGALPVCAGAIEARAVSVTKVDDNGTLVLADGRAVHLEGVLLADGAVAALKDLAGGRQMSAAALPPKFDRYGRIRGQVALPDVWLQAELLRRGLARVYIAPERRECAKELFAAEQQGRAAGAGIWSEKTYAVRAPEDLRWRDIGTFQIVEGKILRADAKNGRAYLDFGADWKRDFTATIPPATMQMYRALGIDPRTFTGLVVRVRGWVEEFNGPEIEVLTPEDVELVQ